MKLHGKKLRLAFFSTILLWFVFLSSPAMSAGTDSPDLFKRFTNKEHGQHTACAKDTAVMPNGQFFNKFFI